MVAWLKSIWKDSKERHGILAVLVTMFVCLLVSTMFGVNMVWPSIVTGGCWLCGSVVSFFMFMGFSGRMSDVG